MNSDRKYVEVFVDFEPVRIVSMNHLTLKEMAHLSTIGGDLFALLAVLKGLLYDETDLMKIESVTAKELLEFFEDWRTVSDE